MQSIKGLQLQEDRGPMAYARAASRPDLWLQSHRKTVLWQ